MAKTARQSNAERAARAAAFAEALAAAWAESAPLFSAPRVCKGCGCTDEDACLVGRAIKYGSQYHQCWWVADDLCVGCAEGWGWERLRGPLVDHRAPAGTGADDAAPAGERE